MTNTGNVTLTNVTVTDPQRLSDDHLRLRRHSTPTASCEVTETWTYTGTYAVTQADIDAGSVYNLATADSDEIRARHRRQRPSRCRRTR